MFRARRGIRLRSRPATPASVWFWTAGSFVAAPHEGFRALPARLAYGPKPAAPPCSRASKSQPCISHDQRRITMRYHLAPLSVRPWTLNGISARLIESHYENNYGGALNRLNAISEEIEQLALSNTSGQSLARPKRDE